ncbi:MAG: DUF3604 domain-containing protein [candidate division WS1 bacterium]|nr:DUF3604 domain-containing protein [candidate division WS1 bacterium]
MQPSVLAVDEPGALKVALLDADGYPSLEYQGEVTLEGLPGGTCALAFRRGESAVGRLDNISLPQPGLYRFTARFEGGYAKGNPTRCLTHVEQHLYWGDPHVHTVLSDCWPQSCRSLDFCYVAARYLAGLDWVCATDHVSNGRCEFARWKEQRAACNVHDDPPAFATLHGYEASLQGGAGGDANVYLARPLPMFLDDYEGGTLKSLGEKLAAELPEKEFFLVPHHTTRAGKHGEISDAIYPGPNRMPLVEIHSKWGTSEYRGNPNALREVHPGPSYVADFLRRGMVFGFMGGTDTHATMPAGRGVEHAEHLDGLPGMTAVRSATLSRETIFQALRRRQCYATSGDRIYLEATVAGSPGGEVLPIQDPGRPRGIAVFAAAPGDIERIEVLRNGDVLHAREIRDWHATLELTDEEPLGPCLLESAAGKQFAYYYVRVTCTSGAQAWSSPVWLQE